MLPLFVRARLRTSYARSRSFVLAYATPPPRKWARSAIWFTVILLGLMQVGGFTEPIHPLTSDPEKTRAEDCVPREASVQRIAPGARIAPPGGLHG
ncbi:hypothetical protein [Salipiger thiooxidans]|uniref:hypothetical protein n=1 Tax=Salipiger thiooxidans TaxID=282683 RepID=UPI001A8EE6C2|nr:hypothetical protein [Salipiger thiooxidans]